MATPPGSRVSSAPGAAPTPTAPPTSDWTAQVVDTIESVVGTVRDKTTVPLETVTRALVYGILIAVLGVAALILLTIVVVRAGSYVLPVWAVDAIAGTLFCAAGLFAWRKRRPAVQRDKKG